MMEKQIILVYSKYERKTGRIKKGDMHTAYGAWLCMRSQMPVPQQRISPPFTE
jgi:hypothetical protein